MTFFFFKNYNPPSTTSSQKQFPSMQKMGMKASFSSVGLSENAHPSASPVAKALFASLPSVANASAVFVSVIWREDTLHGLFMGEHVPCAENHKHWRSKHLLTQYASTECI